MIFTMQLFIVNYSRTCHKDHLSSRAKTCKKWPHFWSPTLVHSCLIYLSTTTTCLQDHDLFVPIVVSVDRFHCTWNSKYNFSWSIIWHSNFNYYWSKHDIQSAIIFDQLYMAFNDPLFLINYMVFNDPQFMIIYMLFNMFHYSWSIYGIQWSML